MSLKYNRLELTEWHRQNDDLQFPEYDDDKKLILAPPTTPRLVETVKRQTLQYTALKYEHSQRKLLISRSSTTTPHPPPSPSPSPSLSPSKDESTKKNNYDYSTYSPRSKAGDKDQTATEIDFRINNLRQDEDLRNALHKQNKQISQSRNALKAEVKSKIANPRSAQARLLAVQRRIDDNAKIADDKITEAFNKRMLDERSRSITKTKVDWITEKKYTQQWIKLIALTVSTKHFQKSLMNTTSNLGLTKLKHDSAVRIQRYFHRRRLNRTTKSIRSAATKIRSIMAKFVDNWRLKRKRRAVDLIITLLYAFKETPIRWVIRSFTTSIKKCQRTIRSYIACKNARIQLLVLKWNKMEDVAYKIKKTELIQKAELRKVSEDKMQFERVNLTEFKTTRSPVASKNVIHKHKLAAAANAKLIDIGLANELRLLTKRKKTEKPVKLKMCNDLLSAKRRQFRLSSKLLLEKRRNQELSNVRPISTDDVKEMLKIGGVVPTQFLNIGFASASYSVGLNNRDNFKLLTSIPAAEILQSIDTGLKETEKRKWFYRNGLNFQGRAKASSVYVVEEGRGSAEDVKTMRMMVVIKEKRRLLAMKDALVDHDDTFENSMTLQYKGGGGNSNRNNRNSVRERRQSRSVNEDTEKDMMDKYGGNSNSVRDRRQSRSIISEDEEKEMMNKYGGIVGMKFDEEDDEEEEEAEDDIEADYLAVVEAKRKALKEEEEEKNQNKSNNHLAVVEAKRKALKEEAEKNSNDNSPHKNTLRRIIMAKGREIKEIATARNAEAAAAVAEAQSEEQDRLKRIDEEKERLKIIDERSKAITEESEAARKFSKFRRIMRTKGKHIKEIAEARERIKVRAGKVEELEVKII